jgi:hypothetical protein
MPQHNPCRPRLASEFGYLGQYMITKLAWFVKLFAHFSLIPEDMGKFSPISRLTSVLARDETVL